MLHDAFTCCLPSSFEHKRKSINQSINQVRYNLGVPGKTKEGYDCYVHYDKDCTPVGSGPKAKAAIMAPAKPFCHPFDPSCNKFSSPANAETPKAAGDGVILPHPDCDPEYDYNCRLRRAEPAAAATAEGTAAAEPAKETPGRRFEDFLRGVMRQHK